LKYLSTAKVNNFLFSSYLKFLEFKKSLKKKNRLKNKPKKKYLISQKPKNRQKKYNPLFRTSKKLLQIIIIILLLISLQLEKLRLQQMVNPHQAKLTQIQATRFQSVLKKTKIV
jgi:hypothetical protein